MNGLEKPFRKNRIQKIEEKPVKTKVKSPHLTKNHYRESEFRSNTVFSLYFKIRAKNFMLLNHLFFRSISCFGMTKITTPI